MNLTKSTVWKFEHARLHCEVVHWGIEREHGFEPLNNGQGCWNYYVWITEKQVGTATFEKDLWLPDAVVKTTHESYGFVSHDYYSKSFSSVEWHGGVTFYKKHGHTTGHRSVKIGCDYSHLWDSERGYLYTLEEVVNDCKHTAEALALLFNIKQPKPVSKG